MRRAQRSWIRWLVILGASGMAPEALADTANFELSGKIYTKWLYKNDDTRGCLSLSNPFWQDNIGGGNGVCSEFQLDIKGRVSKYVVTGVRVKSRRDALNRMIREFLPDSPPRDVQTELAVVGRGGRLQVPHHFLNGNGKPGLADGFYQVVHRIQLKTFSRKFRISSRENKKGGGFQHPCQIGPLELRHIDVQEQQVDGPELQFLHSGNRVGRLAGKLQNRGGLHMLLQDADG